MERERNESGRYNDRIEPDTVLEIFEQRDDQAEPLTASDVVDEMDIARRTAHNKLNELTERGVLETKKVGARGRVWWTPIRDAIEGHSTPVEQSPVERDVSPEPIEEPRENEPAAAETDPLDELEFPSGKDQSECKATIRAARDYLQENGPATKSQIVAEIMPQYSLGYDSDAALSKIEAGDRYRGAWWRRIVKPGLEALDDVEKPARGQSEWKYNE